MNSMPSVVNTAYAPIISNNENAMLLPEQHQGKTKVKTKGETYECCLKEEGKSNGK